ncbi:MAG: hypothetical protein WBI53_09085, partial [Paludibacter sp.]
MKNKFIIFFLLVLSYNVYGQSVSLSTSAVTIGGGLTVNWSGFSGLVNVYVAQGSNNKWKEANTQGGSSGSQWIGTDATWGVRSDYRIYIELKSNTNIYSYSNYFSVTSLSPSVPSLTYPTNGAILNDNTPDLSWSANNASYFDVQIDNSSSFTSIDRENSS